MSNTDLINLVAQKEPVLLMEFSDSLGYFSLDLRAEQNLPLNSRCIQNEIAASTPWCLRSQKTLCNTSGQTQILRRDLHPIQPDLVRLVFAGAFVVVPDLVAELDCVHIPERAGAPG